MVFEHPPRAGGPDFQLGQAQPLTESGLPSESELFHGSSVLSVFRGLHRSSRAHELAVAEYAHYLEVTHAFESTGYELILLIQPHADSEEMAYAFRSQRTDEENHKRAYGAVVAALPAHVPHDTQHSRELLRQIHDSFVSSHNLAEMIVKGFIVLESLAYGMFVARLRYYPKGPTRLLDLQVLKEETQHQNCGIGFLKEQLSRKAIDLQTIETIIHSEIRRLSRGTPPTHLLEYAATTSKPSNQWMRSGLPGMQMRVSARRMCLLLRHLREGGPL